MDMTPSSVEIQYGVSRPRRMANVIEPRITECKSKEAAERLIEGSGGVLVCRTIIVTDWTLPEVD